MTDWLPWLLLSAPAVLPAGLTMLNLFTWARGRPGARFNGDVSVLIPARNEEQTIEQCVRSALASTHPLLEVVVFDDASDDATPDILARIAEEDERLRIVKGTGLPEGWVGKPHACHQLARHARGTLLVFIDADTALEPEGVERIASLIEDCDLLTAVPRQITITPPEQIVLPLLHLTYTAWLPLPLIHLTQDPRVLAANGQILAVRRSAYDMIGGFASVKTEVVDDMAFCRRMKSAGGRVRFADGYQISSCRMYTSTQEIWEGFSKNLYEGIGESPFALLGVVALYSLAFIVPYIALFFAIDAGAAAAWTAAAAVGVGANLLTRGALAGRYGHSLLSVIAHPIAVMFLLALAVNSFLWSRRGQIRWRGRVYAARGER
ncbi:MAG: glycosyltransferase family 2 protein [Myxococcota bacterium]